jgi:hypothetical protein
VFLLPDTESGGSAYGDKRGDLAIGGKLRARRSQEDVGVAG